MVTSPKVSSQYPPLSLVSFILFIKLTVFTTPPKHYPNVNADRVRQYACRMIKQRQLWVYEAQKDPEDLIIRSKEQQENAKHIISVCEVSRRSRKVVVLDKLFTAENYRGRGYATHLLRHIINQYGYLISYEVITDLII